MRSDDAGLPVTVADTAFAERSLVERRLALREGEHPVAVVEAVAEALTAGGRWWLVGRTARKTSR